MGGIGARIAKVPKLVWIVGGGIIVAFVIFKGKGGGGGTATGTPSGLDTSGGGGGGGGSADQSTLTGADLAQFLADEAQQQADFYQQLQDLMGGVVPPTPVGGGGAGGLQGNGAGPPVQPPAPAGGGTKPPAPKTQTYKVSLTGRTSLLSGTLAKLGFGASGTYLATKVRVKGHDYFRFKRGGKWTLVPVSAKTIKVTPVK